MRFIAIIPARGGSKGVPRKNIAPVAGRPLIAHTIESSLAARSIARTIVSTEDEEIAQVALQEGAEVPFRRPVELAADHTPTPDVLRHAILWLEEQGETLDAVVLLQPTSPMRGVDNIDRACRLFEESNADTLISVLPVPFDHHPSWVFLDGPDGTVEPALGRPVPPQRQALSPAWFRDGSIYIIRKEIIVEETSVFGDKIVPFPVDPVNTVNIDRPEDLVKADQLLSALQS